MAYKKQTWVDDETVGTADRFNHMEAGIEEAGKTGGVSTGAVIGWTGEEIPEGYEEVDSSLIPSGVEVGTIVEWDDSKPVPEGYEEVEAFNIYKATIDDTYLTRGDLEVAQYGKLVILTFKDVEFKISMVGSNDATLFTGIPTPSSKYDSEIPLYFMLNGFNLVSGARIAIRGNRVTTYFLNTSEPLTALYTGQFMYFID